MPEFLSKTQAGLAEISAYSDEYEKNPPKLLGGDHTLEACGVKVDISRQRLNEEELKHFEPSMEIDDAEDAIYSRDLTDMMDVLQEMVRESRN